jgi:hypothetical protein
MEKETNKFFENVAELKYFGRTAFMKKLSAD